ncbi:CHRD domain-containing protein [Deinococcus peraridilitoris]|uniref:CHRD domain-containing protein n=1 Tax=Deinococcus peraridilitoris (strain DSM 19664 / LMG 22246 / CIP 109416 / KR-200) TaxID=937777 RepID=L0A6E9_DEIPD|nr:CHRD domain-containing protein [Deinococcus peraridilitoris]AFZ68747.1 CHRD domain-containing protein [Deinococcus peraridilitoris DSM 19664]
MSETKQLHRRQVLSGAGIVGLGAVLASCAPATAQQPAATSEYSANMMPGNVLPTPPTNTNAISVATATLQGNRLRVRGSYAGLSGPLRNYATDPVDPPNPRITSAVHIHQMAADPAAMPNGPFLFAMTVMMTNANSGTFTGDVTLTDAQRAALMAGNFYMDIHTTTNRAGEVRGPLTVIQGS